jgi:hypothetical protein
VEGRQPDVAALGRRRELRLDEERNRPRPRGIPATRAVQDGHAAGFREGADGSGAPFGQHLDGTCQQAGAAEPCLADRGRCRFPDLLVRPEAAQVDHDGRRPQARQRAGGHGERGGADALADIGEARPSAQAALQRLGAREIPPGRRHLEGRHERIGRVVADEVAGDAVRHAERTCQERSVDILDDQEPARDERPRRPEPRPAGARRAACTDQLQGKADARPAARDVIVEVAVQPLEARVEVRRQRDEQELHVELLERK